MRDHPFLHKGTLAVVIPTFTHKNMEVTMVTKITVEGIGPLHFGS